MRGPVARHAAVAALLTASLLAFSGGDAEAGYRRGVTPTPRPSRTPTTVPTAAPAPTATPTPGPTTTWTEPWADTSGWDPVGWPNATVSGGRLTQINQSAALQSKRTWDASKPIVLSGTVSGEPAPGSSTTDFWAGLVLFQKDDGPGASYAQFAVERHVPPFTSRSTQLVSLTLPNYPGGSALSSGAAGRDYAFSIAWNPSTGKVTYSIDGQVVQTRLASLSGPVRVWTICVSVGAGRPDNGSAAQCEYGPVTVDS